jgi:hypothetical protein
MNNLDEYWFWVSMAISEPTSSNNNYFYDIKLDTLFGLNIKSNLMLPIFRNSFSKNNRQIIAVFKEEISKLECLDENIILLPKLSFEKKHEFLFHFAININEELIVIKKQLLMEVSYFSEFDQFDYRTKFKDQCPALFFDFQVQKGIFIAEQVKTLFVPLGISEKSLLIW